MTKKEYKEAKASIVELICEGTDQADRALGFRLLAELEATYRR